MSNDLISRKKLLEEINNFSMRITGSFNTAQISAVKETKKSIMRIINEQPAIYDAERIAKLIEEAEAKEREVKELRAFLERAKEA